MPHAYNRYVLTRTNIDDSHAIVTCFTVFICKIHYSINTEASSKFAVADVNERLVRSKIYTDSDIVKVEEQATVRENFNDNDLACELLLKAR